MAFMRILSPKSAPPVFLLEGSTEISPIVFSGKSSRNLRTNSSTKEDLPAPPVPVIPSTGVLRVSFFLWMVFIAFFATSGKFSAEDITRAIAPGSLLESFATSPFRESPMGKSEVLTRSFIIPCKPISLPSSGE